MKIYREFAELRQARLHYITMNLTVGFVPTMGYLHEGHLSLVRDARENNDLVGVSIFINPTQFGENEDFEQYPRDESRDLELLETEGVDWVYIPNPRDIYPEGFSTYVTPPANATRWEGERRPIHFRGVCTVVSILFNQVRPTRAYFGRKDAQQLAVIRQMNDDLALGVEIVSGETIRETSGLAMSSRNNYLSPKQTEQALVLSQALQQGVDQYQLGETDPANIIRTGESLIQTVSGVELDYLALVDEITMEPVTEVKPGTLYMGVIRINSIRLLDNLIIPGDPQVLG